MLLLLTDGIAGDVAGDGVVVWLLAEVLWLLTDGIAGAAAGDGVVVGRGVVVVDRWNSRSSGRRWGGCWQRCCGC